jgi:hypothetical protein
MNKDNNLSPPLSLSLSLDALVLPISVLIGSKLLPRDRDIYVRRESHTLSYRRVKKDIVDLRRQTSQAPLAAYQYRASSNEENGRLYPVDK